MVDERRFEDSSSSEDEELTEDEKKVLDPSPLSKGMVKPSKNSSKKAERRAAREAVIAARDNTHDGRKASREGSTKAERRAARETGGGGSQPRPHPKLAVVPRVSTGAVWCGAWNLGS